MDFWACLTLLFNLWILAGTPLTVVLTPLAQFCPLLLVGDEWMLCSAGPHCECLSRVGMKPHFLETDPMTDVAIILLLWLVISILLFVRRPQGSPGHRQKTDNIGHL